MVLCSLIGRNTFFRTDTTRGREDPQAPKEPPRTQIRYPQAPGRAESGFTVAHGKVQPPNRPLTESAGHIAQTVTAKTVVSPADRAQESPSVFPRLQTLKKKKTGRAFSAAGTRQLLPQFFNAYNIVILSTEMLFYYALKATPPGAAVISRSDQSARRRPR
ncbi:hypothetical protein BaRGS_00012882, partial [Batillaria attramentaria]